MILFSVISPVKPINDWKETMKSDVPTAIFIGFFAKISKVGTIKKPPPAPTKPESKPIRIPRKTIF